MSHKWYARYSSGTKSFYAIRNGRDNNGKRITIYMSRVIATVDNGLVVDHIDHDTLNNQIINLRACSHLNNMTNQGKKSSNKSGYKGVSWYPQSNKYRATIQYNYKLHHLGYYDCPKEAHKAYCEASCRLHGEFSNFG